MSRTLYFGCRWDAPVLDGATPFAETPYWARCTTCRQYFEDGDQGLITPTLGDVDPDYLIGAGASVTLTGQHRECALSGVAGHIVGVCSCTGWDTSARTTSIEVQRRVDAGVLRATLPAAQAWDDPVLYEHWSLQARPVDTVTTTGERL